MQYISGYEAIEALSRDSETSLYRGVRLDDGASVLIKVLNAAYPTAEQLARFRWEYRIGSEVACDRLLRYLALERHDNGLALIVEDIGGAPLEQLLSGGVDSSRGGASRRDASFRCGGDSAAFLDLAIAISAAVEQLHAHRIIHRNIHPGNIFINPETGQVRLTNLARAARLTRQNEGLAALAGAVEITPYLAPEQTGRMSRVVDYRADYYALGATLYAMLSGGPPFSAADPLELIHCHIARQPTALHVLCPGIAAPVEAIVSKLLAKNPEERYQSAAGVRRDLEACRQRLASTGTIEGVRLGQSDVPEWLQIPHRLYGRQRELATLMSALERAQDGTTQIVMLRGWAGAGKSALAGDLRRAVAEHRGHFGSSALESSRRAMPYGVWIAVVQDLIGQIASQKSERVAAWGHTLRAALGPGGRLLMGLVPELAWLIGDQLPLAAVDVSRARARIHKAFRDLLLAIAAAEPPLVVFLDDLHMADRSSLDLLDALAREVRDTALLIIGAYRDNQLGAAHPLTAVLDVMTGTQPRPAATPLFIDVAPLGQGEVSDLLADTLRVAGDAVSELGAMVHAKTGGNPLFVRELLRAAQEHDALWLDTERAHWDWDIDAIGDIVLASDIGELLASRLDRLDDHAQALVQICACAGNRFDLDLVARVGHLSRARAAALLEEAVRCGVVIALGDAHKYMVELNEQRQASPTRVSYRFAHERIQQAAYARIPAGARARHHQAIALALLDPEPPVATIAAASRGDILASETALDPEATIEAALFDIVDHFNRAATLLVSESEERRIECARLELRAARKAMGAGAFEAAAGYLDAALALLGECSGAPCRELRIEVRMRRGECDYLRSQYQRAEQQLLELLGDVDSLGAALRIHIHLVRTQLAIPNPAGALHYGRAGAALYGEHLPADEHDIAATVAAELPALMVEIEARSRAALLAQPAITDTDKALLIELYYHTCIAGLHTSKLSSTLIGLRMIRLSLDWGGSPFLPLAYVVVAQHALLQSEDYPTVRMYSAIAYDLAQASDDQSIKNMINASLALSMLYWQRPIDDSARLVAECSASSLAIGEINLGIGLFTYAIGLDLLRGTPLDTVERRAEEYLDVVARTGDMGGSLLIRYRAVRALRGGTASGTSLDGEGFDEAEIAAIAAKGGNRLLYVNYSVVKLQLACVFGDHAQAYERARFLVGELPLVINTFVYSELCFYHAYALAALSRPGQRDHLDELETCLARLTTWAELCPQNFLHHRLLIEAECARIGGDLASAMTCYDRAIDAALEQGYLHIAAIAAERAARFYLDQGRRRIARAYFDQADYSYARWGAEAKVLALRHELGSLLGGMPGGPPGGSGTGAGASMNGLGVGLSRQLDAGTIVEATQAISRELVLENVLRKLVHLVMEHAGARHTLLLLDHLGELRIEAEGTVEPEVIEVLQSAPVEGRTALPVSLVSFVARTRRDVIIDDAAMGTEFRDDPYIAAGRVRSILCAPIQHQGKLTGVLYVENDLTAAAFTRDRVDVLRSIASQAAISIENARLYAELERSMERVARLERERLMTRLSRFQAVIEASGDLIGLCSLAGDILYMNPAGMSLLGRLGDDHGSMNLTELFPGPASQRIAGELVSAVQRNGHWTGELELRQGDAGTVPVSVAFTLVRSQAGEPIGAGIIARDISDSKRAQAELHKAKESAEQANRAKSEFLANMSHELRTPMNAIIGLTELLLGTELGAEQRQFLEIIHASGDSLLVLINDILDLSKIEAGKLKFDIQPFALREHLDAGLEIHAAAAATKSIDLVAAYSASVPEVIAGDRGRLRQVLGNLLGNAVKFTDQGHVVLRASASMTGRDQCDLHFVVEDTGIGIASDKVARLFQPFSQVDASLSRKYGGTGLGLAISRRLIEAMGGRIWVESHPGQGSRFHATIPARVVPSDQPVHRQPEQPLLRGKRIMVVGNRTLARKVLLDQIRAWGMIADVPDTATMARSMAAGAVVALIHEQTEWLQAEGSERGALMEELRRRLPIVLVAGLHARGLDEARRVSDVLLLEPVKAAQLHRALRQVLADPEPAKPASMSEAAAGEPEHHDDETPEQASAQAPLATRLPLRILVAEDNAINLRVALAMLARLGYRADVARNGQEALSALRDRRYDVVLMDVQMPDMDGVEAAQRIRADLPRSEWPRIIALTAHAMAGDREYLLAAGMDDYLSKPIRMAELIQALQRVR